MKRIFRVLAYRLFILAASVIVSIPAAVASDRGQLLYENHCQSCHDKNVHEREDRLVTSPELLRAWVVSWVVHNGLPWSEEEIADITAYLDQSLYHFSE